MPVNYVTKDDLELLIWGRIPRPQLNTTETMMEAPFRPWDLAHRQHHLPKGEYRPTAFFFEESPLFFASVVPVLAKRSVPNQECMFVIKCPF